MLSQTNTLLLENDIEKPLTLKYNQKPPEKNSRDLVKLIPIDKPQPIDDEGSTDEESPNKEDAWPTRPRFESIPLLETKSASWTDFEGTSGSSLQM